MKLEDLDRDTMHNVSSTLLAVSLLALFGSMGFEGDFSDFLFWLSFLSMTAFAVLVVIDIWREEDHAGPKV